MKKQTTLNRLAAVRSIEAEVAVLCFAFEPGPDRDAMILRLLFKAATRTGTTDFRIVRMGVNHYWMNGAISPCHVDSSLIRRGKRLGMSNNQRRHWIACVAESAANTVLPGESADTAGVLFVSRRTGLTRSVRSSLSRGAFSLDAN